ncbi:MAG: hypothetical protein KGM24_11360 [Elusimicrobia bacterium]|nr:hypothetical protein [Elusimicrobiota bacterium]
MHSPARAAALAVLLAPVFASPARAAGAPPAASTAPVHLALIEDVPARVTMMLAQPIERVLRENASTGSLVAVDEIPVDFAGRDFRFRLPDRLGAPDTSATAEAAALESDSEIAFVYPADDSLIAALSSAAADPSTYDVPNSVDLDRREAEAAVSASAGRTTLSVRADLAQPAAMRWRTGLSVYYRLRWKGRDAFVAVVGRTYGGLGRLYSAAERERERGGPFTGLARGGTFGGAGSDADGRAVLDALEKAGLRWSTIADSELTHWDQLQAYLKERPDGVRYVSADLVYSTAPDTTVFPPYAVFTASGTRVAILGLTSPGAARLLDLPGLPKLAVKDPVLAAEALIPELRAQADVVVALSAMSPADNARLASSLRGIDLILADDAPFLSFATPPKTVVAQGERRPFANPFPPIRAYDPALNLVSILRRPAPDGGEDWRVAQSAVLLDDSLPPAQGFPEAAFSDFAAASSTEPALLPSARETFPPSRRAGLPVYRARDFWTLAAGLETERARAEAGLLPAWGLPEQTVGEVRRALARKWLGRRDEPVTVAVDGSRLKTLADRAAAQADREAKGLPPSGGLSFVVSGFDAKGFLHGAPLDPSGTYRLATTRSAAEALGLPPPYDPVPGAATLVAAVLPGLEARAGADPDDYRAWMGGAPLAEPGLWKINFRDISLNVQQTKVQTSDAFDSVVNARAQGADELTIGGAVKTDAIYLHREYKWTNTLEMEYAKDRISPRNAPASTNLSANRIMLLSLDTKRVGGIPYGWLAQSWGPSLGAEFDGEFVPSTPGLPRKQVYSVFPGFEFYDGSVLSSLETTGIVKRDLSRVPPNTQTGLRLRALVSTPVGGRGATLSGELWNNYFFLTRSDNASDLRVEGDANAKLSIPVRKYLSVSPSVDLYWFELKTRPLWGYSLMTGISIGFSRLWKPQYEPF